MCLSSSETWANIQFISVSKSPSLMLGTTLDLRGVFETEWNCTGIARRKLSVVWKTWGFKTFNFSQLGGYLMVLSKWLIFSEPQDSQY